jgi:HK97 family phage portal protein
MTLQERIRAMVRAFTTGPADVTESAATWGYAPDTYQPAQYVDYLATSNAVYTCARLRAEALASLPIRLYRGTAENKTEVTRGPLYDLLHKVNQFWTMQRLLSMWEYSMCLWGESYIFLERGERGNQPPVELWWARSDRVYVYPDPVDYIKGYGYMGEDGTAPIPYTPGEVLAFRYPNPANQWRGLSPLAAARLAADSASAAMKSNRNIFANGIQMGGMISPPAGVTLTEDQIRQISEGLENRFKGVDKAHRWGVFKFAVDPKPVGITPKDAEFLGLLKWTLEDVCRAFSVPLDLVGGQRTYDNINAALLAFWTNCIIPEKRMMESEMAEQLLPMFPGQADSVELDTSEIAVLKDDDAAAWTMASGQLDKGAITINEWRTSQGLKPVAWGDVYWASSSMTPIENGEKPEPLPAPVVMQAPPAEKPEEPEEEAPEEETPEPARMMRMAIPYGGEIHRLRWNAFVRSTDDWERKLTPVVQELFRRQSQSVLAKLRARAMRSAADVAEDPFDRETWERRFRETVKVVIEAVVEAGGAEALKDLGLSMAFDVHDPRVDAFIKARVQRFAEHVNDTTYEALQKELIAGINEGESIPQLAARVEATMGDRIKSTPETIARTEVIGGYNGGTLEAWKQSGVVTKKAWLAALDDRTRATHSEAHARYQAEPIPIDEDFQVGDASGPAPGETGAAEEDINCRCSMTAVVDVLDK